MVMKYGNMHTELQKFYSKSYLDGNRILVIVEDVLSSVLVRLLLRKLTGVGGALVTLGVFSFGGVTVN